MMLDEADVWMKGRDEGAAAVRAVVNEGHMRGGGVLRCVGDDHEVRRFRCDCPKAIAGIGDFMAPATADRCIIITLDKAPRSVRLDNFRGDHPLAPELPGLLKRWAADHGDEYAAHDPDTGRLTGRDADNWRPLYGVADLAGGSGPGASGKLLRRSMGVLTSAQRSAAGMSNC